MMVVMLLLMFMVTIVVGFAVGCTNMAKRLIV